MTLVTIINYVHIMHYFHVDTCGYSRTPGSIFTIIGTEP